MGRTFWITSVGAAVAVLYGLSLGPINLEKTATSETPVAIMPVVAEEFATAEASPDIGKPQALSVRSGSALATAAFGMSALQPETYDGQVVAYIIAASPLHEIEKLQLTANLEAAEAGQADLPTVLSDVRVALAIE